MGFLFSTHGVVSRAAYLRCGIALAILKVLLEGLLLYLSTGHLHGPATYFLPTAFPSPHAQQASSWLLWARLLLNLPFVWIALAMSVRRLRDAGLFPLFALLVLIPVVNILVIIGFCLAESKTGDVRQGLREPTRPAKRQSGTWLVAIVAGSLTGVLVVLIGVLVFSAYGLTAFIIAPILAGTVSAVVLGRQGGSSTSASLAAATLATLLGSSILLFIGFEGAICLLMALPLALAMAMLGSAIGLGIVECSGRKRKGSAQVWLVLLALPVLCGMDARISRPELRRVETQIEIDAPPEVVWKNVIAFPRLAEPQSLLFRSGVAYPISARIEGEGVGAVRYCEFSTGAFVEPITAWEAPKRLAFDVTEQPHPMREWSPYSIHPPHLDGALKSERGQFLLEPLPGGRTRLTGHTWYRIEMFPQAYWQVWCDGIIHRIHQRVLVHIRAVCEAPDSQ
jgi:uncharacterized membrane protein YhaH (DUF805 family)